MSTEYRINREGLDEGNEVGTYLRHFPFLGAKSGDVWINGKSYGSVNVVDETAKGEEYVLKGKVASGAGRGVEGLLGNLVRFPLTLKHESLPGGKFVFPNQPMIVVSGQKRIVETEVAGRDFEVTEIIGLQNYRVELRGIVSFMGSEGWNDEYPTEDVVSFTNLYKKHVAYGVECEYLALFGITRLLIKSLNIINAEGAEGWFAYDIQAKSDEPYELEIFGS